MTDYTRPLGRLLVGLRAAILLVTLLEAQSGALSQDLAPVPLVLGALAVWTVVAGFLQGRAAVVRAIGDAGAGLFLMAAGGVSGAPWVGLAVLQGFGAGAVVGGVMLVLALAAWPVMLHVQGVASRIWWYYGLLGLAAVAGASFDMLRRLQVQAASLVSVIRTGQALGTSASQDRVLSLVAQNVKDLVDCSTCVVFLSDARSGEPALRVAHAASPVPDAFRDFNPMVEKSVVGSALSLRAGVRVDDFAEGPDEQVVRKDRALRSVMASPMLFEDEVLGVLVVAQPYPRAWTDEHLALLDMLANQAALAVRNIQLHTETVEMAVTDSLSGLFTHGYFQDHLTREYAEAKRNGQPLSLLILDVDFFKKINDTHGHPQGDALLKQMGGLLRETTREFKALCRYGGDEFTVTMPATSRIGAVVVAERVREAIENYEFVLGGRIVHVTVSGGVASFPEDAETSKELVEKADAAMYQAKQRGRNKVCFAS